MHDRVIGRVAELGEETDATRTDINRWRIEQCAMIGEGNVVEIIFIVLVCLLCKVAVNRLKFQQKLFQVTYRCLVKLILFSIIIKQSLQWVITR